MRLVVLDGLDGAGKDSLGRFVQRFYRERGMKVLVRSHPSQNLLGRVTKSSLQRRGEFYRMMASLFYILDVLYSLAVLKRRRKEYDVSILVRYLLGTAYLPKVIGKFAYRFLWNLLPTSRFMFYVDVKPEVAARRVWKRREKIEMFEDEDSLRRIRSVALNLIGNDWIVVDNSGPLEESCDYLRRKLEELERKMGDS